MNRTRLAGWGRTAWSVSDVVSFDSLEHVRDLVQGAGERGVISRGLGRSYGAAAQNAGGLVVLMDQSADVKGPDMFLRAETGILDVSAGVSLDAILRYTVPRGWFIPVTPGTRFVTVGGAIASDIHGKNHHVDGSFGSHVRSMEVMLSDGSTVQLDPVNKSDWFWATVGGMGLTGLILSAEIQLVKIESSRMRVETKRLACFDAVLEAMEPGGVDDDFRYSVCWIDMMATGSAMGRGVLTRGDHAMGSEVEDADPLSYDPHVRLRTPGWVPNGLLNKASVRAFNELWFRKAPRSSHIGIETIPAFFHPLDGVRDWNRLYGSNGFIQYQMIVPLNSTEVLRKIMTEFSEAGIASFLAVLKRMGPHNPGPLSFPMEGWTLTLDIPAAARGLADLLSRADSLVLDAGGRHYLAKDSHLAASAIRRGYPRLPEWRETRDAMDPAGTWKSDLSRRLGLTGEWRQR